MKFIVEALGLTAGGGKAGLLRLLPSMADGCGHTFVALVAARPEFAALARPNITLIAQRKPAGLVRRDLYLQRTVPRICREERADALLCLGNFGPRRTTLPTVVVLHNACFVSNGAPGSPGSTWRERLIIRYGKRYLRRLPKGVGLVVQTDLMKRRLIEAHGVAASRVEVIPDGDALPARRPGAGSARTAPLPNGGNKPFTFLCLAHYYPHKNLEVLVDATKCLASRVRRPARCVLTIAAEQHPGARRLLRRIAAERMDDLLVNIGQLSGEQAAHAYALADAFILPTLLESFGRTYLEAMRYELPILTSDRDFARQICGAAAVYFDPLDPASVAAGMANIVEDGALRARLSAESRRLAQRIPSWSEIAARFVSALERAASGREPAPEPQSAAACAPPSGAAGVHSCAEGEC